MPKSINLKKLQDDQTIAYKKRAVLIDVLVVLFVIAANVVLVTNTKHPEAIRAVLLTYNGALIALGLLTRKKALMLAGLAGLAAVLVAL